MIFYTVFQERGHPGQLPAHGGDRAGGSPTSRSSRTTPTPCSRKAGAGDRGETRRPITTSSWRARGSTSTTIRPAPSKRWWTCSRTSRCPARGSTSRTTAKFEEAVYRAAIYGPREHARDVVQHALDNLGFANRKAIENGIKRIRQVPRRERQLHGDADIRGDRLPIDRAEGAPTLRAHQAARGRGGLLAGRSDGVRPELRAHVESRGATVRPPSCPRPRRLRQAAREAVGRHPAGRLGTAIRAPGFGRAAYCSLAEIHASRSQGASFDGSCEADDSVAFCS